MSPDRACKILARISGINPNTHNDLFLSFRNPIRSRLLIRLIEALEIPTILFINANGHWKLIPKSIAKLKNGMYWMVAVMQ